MNDALLELYRHKTWATLRLIDHCQGLDDAHLDATIPGTFGTIRETLHHLVRSEEGYFFTVTGERLSEPLADVGNLGDGPPAPLGELAERLRRLGPRWENLATDTDADQGEVTTRDGWRMHRVVPMAQAIHHADDHRSHVLSILGACGLEVPDLDVWSYAESAGLMWEVKL
ncbi:MAG TPA: DinB family protein [Chloroflexota bacterium]|nr:DinB family protein [Chloroflexota bacterium]